MEIRKISMCSTRCHNTGCIRNYKYYIHHNASEVRWTVGVFDPEMLGWMMKELEPIVLKEVFRTITDDTHHFENTDICEGYIEETEIKNGRI